jgi:cytidine deaminase
VSGSDELFAAARQAMGHAHVPYSKFPVGAAIRSESGAIYAGANIENASYPEGWCAETSAISHMVMAGDRRIVELAVVAERMDRITPCGGCRQRLREFGSAETRVHLCDRDGVVETVRLGDLLPKAFDSRRLAEAAADGPPPAHDKTGDTGLNVPARNAARDNAELIRSYGALPPKVAIILGSGLGDFTRDVEDPLAIPFGDLDGFPAPGVSGHAGTLVMGRIGATPVAVLAGRGHYYEHGRSDAMRPALETIKALGARRSW